MLEFGGGGSTMRWSSDPAISNWHTVEHHPIWAARLIDSLHASNPHNSRVSVTFVPPKHDIITLLSDSSSTEYEVHGQMNRIVVPSPDPSSSPPPLVRTTLDKTDIGTTANYASYVEHAFSQNSLQELSPPPATVLVLADGRARVDVGIALLPLLSLSSEGYYYLLVHDWDEASHQRSCYGPVLSTFYDVVRTVETLKVLRAKPREELEKVWGSGRYNWCFGWGENLVLRADDQPMNPADPAFAAALRTASAESLDSVMCKSDFGDRSWTSKMTISDLFLKDLAPDEKRALEDAAPSEREFNVTKSCVMCSNIDRSVFGRAELIERVFKRIFEGNRS